MGKSTHKKEYDFEHCLTRTRPNGPYFMDDVKAAILKTQGNLTAMAILLRRNRGRVRDYVLAHVETMELLRQVREELLDRAEQTHNELALSGDGPSLRFLLQTLGKERGYTTRVEQTGPHGKPIETVTIDASKLTSAQLRAIQRASKIETLEVSGNGEAR